jgi:hypothetical protein
MPPGSGPRVSLEQPAFMAAATRPLAAALLALLPAAP